MTEWCLVNGELKEEGFLSLDDRGVALGDGLFETIALYQGVPLALTEHLARMRQSAKILHFTLPFEQSTVAEGIALLAERKKIERGVVRLMLTRGSGPRGYSAEGSHSPNWFITLNRYTPLPDHMRCKGMVVTVATLQKNRLSPINCHKTTSSLERISQMDEAKRAGAEESVTLSLEGNISSFVAGNIFWVGEDGALYTPSRDCAILPGITRALLLTLAADAGLEITQGEWPLSTLASATEIFLTNSLMEIMPVREVKGHFAAPPVGPITEKLQQAYAAYVAAATQAHPLSLPTSER